MKIWVSGSLAYDRIMDYRGKFADHINPKKIHVLSLSFAVEKLELSYGGTAGNIAYNLRLLGAPAGVVGNLGRDGEEYRLRLKKLGADLSCAAVCPDTLTAGAYIITDQADNQIAGFFSGAMSAESRLPKSRPADLAIVAADSVTNMMRLSLHYQKTRTPYIFDPGQQITALSASYMRQGVKGAAIVIGNDYEMEQIYKRSGMRLAASQVSATTLGDKGSVISAGGREYRISAVKARRAADPTGAGDAYRAGLLAGIARKLPWEKTGRLASTVASYAVENYGTQNHNFTWADIQNRYFKQFKERLNS